MKKLFSFSLLLIIIANTSLIASNTKNYGSFTVVGSDNPAYYSRNTSPVQAVPHSLGSSPEQMELESLDGEQYPQEEAAPPHLATNSQDLKIALFDFALTLFETFSDTPWVEILPYAFKDLGNGQIISTWPHPGNLHERLNATIFEFYLTQIPFAPDWQQRSTILLCHIGHAINNPSVRDNPSVLDLYRYLYLLVKDFEMQRQAIG